LAARSFQIFSDSSETERVNFALTYNPWAEGKQPEFVKQPQEQK